MPAPAPAKAASTPGSTTNMLTAIAAGTHSDRHQEIFALGSGGDVYHAWNWLKDEGIAATTSSPLMVTAGPGRPSPPCPQPLPTFPPARSPPLVDADRGWGLDVRGVVRRHALGGSTYVSRRSRRTKRSATPVDAAAGRSRSFPPNEPRPSCRSRHARTGHRACRQSLPRSENMRNRKSNINKGVQSIARPLPSG